MTEYLIPTGAGESEYVEKRSSFLGHLRCVETEDEARAFIAEMKKKYYDARHNCWCYIIRNGAERYSDDGEPQGTAGIPMLEVMRREGVTNVVCVVTRYFGGILLGAGGLLRAYTKSAKDALDAAGISVVRRWIEADIPCSYSQAEKLKNEIAAAGGIVGDMEYGAAVVIKVLVPEEMIEDFKAKIFDVTAGSVTVKVTGESFKAVPKK
ncbi:MAG: YigZ family protein [Eubacteriales bacterium]|nr:YigZ family protein [Eubacteriales bacterium]